MLKKIERTYRLFKLSIFKSIRLIVFFGFRLWLKKVHNKERLPLKGPAILISNHTSYFDWSILSALYNKKYIVFLGNKELLERPIISWLMKLNILIFVDKENPGFSYYKELIRRLKEGHIVVIYPEGTRSKNGKLMEPKPGFVRLAMTTGAPIIPVGMKGAFEILPPNKRFPRFKKCEICVGEPLFVSKENMRIKNAFLNEEIFQGIAVNIMNIIQGMTGQEWDESVKSRSHKLSFSKDKLAAT